MAAIQSMARLGSSGLSFFVIQATAINCRITLVTPTGIEPVFSP
jgi:hypothetical protein